MGVLSDPVQLPWQKKLRKKDIASFARRYVPIKRINFLFFPPKNKHESIPQNQSGTF
jgi:hypothetical protein